MDTTPPPDQSVSDLSTLIENDDGQACAAFLDGLDSSEIVFAVARLEDERRQRLFGLLDADHAADLIALLPQPQAVGTMEELEPAAAARIIGEMPSDERADLIGLLDQSDALAILAELAEPEASDLRRLVAYPPDSAGGLMITEYVQYPESATVGDVIDDLGRNAEKYSEYNIQYAYVTDDAQRLTGVLRMRNLLLTPRQQPLAEVMFRDPLSVADDTDLDDLVDFFDEHRFFGAPVIDGAGKLCGVVERSAVDAAVAAHRESDYLRSQGIVGGEELRSMPLLLRSRRRLSWLSVNILLNLVAASVIARHQDTLEAVIALAVFLPIISDMSGCSGNQAVAVSMRELTLGVIRPNEFWRAIKGELFLGALNGLVLGLLIGAVAFAWKRNVYLGGVVGAALMLNTVVAVLIGGSVPLVLKRLKFDPALASGPILTTITDMCGFFLVLSFASSMLNYLR